LNAGVRRRSRREAWALKPALATALSVPRSMSNRPLLAKEPDQDRAPRGERLAAKVPEPWKTTTFVAGLLTDGPMDGEVIPGYVKQLVAPHCSWGIVRIHELAARQATMRYLPAASPTSIRSSKRWAKLNVTQGSLRRHPHSR
jgi:hypothetical protein